MSVEEAIKILTVEFDDLIDELSEESLYCSEAKINVSDDFSIRQDYANALRIAIKHLETMGL